MKSFGRKKLSGKPYILLTDLKYYAEEFQAFRIISREFNIFGIVFSSAQSVLYRIRYNSDRGHQYTSRAFHQKLEEAGMTQSMSRVAKCIDNGPMEGFWGIIKRERYYGKKFTSREALVKMIEDYIEYYNHKRLQRNLGVLTPFEKHEQYMLVA